MLKLTFSPASPYVRKVLLSAYRAGIQDDIELVYAGTESDKLLRSKNPLGKIPVLQKDDGDFLFDSRVIVEHLNKLGGGLIPEYGSERDVILRRSALAEGLTDASLLVVYSERYAGGETPSKLWLDLQIGKIDRTLKEEILKLFKKDNSELLKNKYKNIIKIDVNKRYKKPLI